MCTMDTTSALDGDLVSKIDTRRPSRYSKLEKADILEMTVRHVQTLHRHEVTAGGRLVGGGRVMGGGKTMGSDEKAKYRAGFIQCAVEVTKYLSNMNGVPNDLHNKVISHLNSVSNSVTSCPGATHTPGVPPGGASVMVGGGMVTVAPPLTGHTSPIAPPLVITTAADSSTGGLSLPERPDYASTTIQFRSPPPLTSPKSPPASTPTTSVTVGAGVTLVPARLASGQVALVLPPGTALPADTTPVPVVNSMSNQAPGSTVPAVPFSNSSRTDSTSIDRLAPSANTFLKDAATSVSSFRSDNPVFPLSCHTSKNINFTLPKNLPTLFDGESNISSSQILFSRNLPVITTSSLMASQNLSPKVDENSCSQTTGATTQLLTHNLQGVNLTASSTSIENQVTQHNTTETNVLVTSSTFPGGIPTTSETWPSPANPQISRSFSNVSREVTSARSNYSASSWCTLGSSTLVKPTPTLPQSTPAAADTDHSQLHTPYSLTILATESPAAPTPSTASPASLHEPLNLVTNNQSRDAVCGRRSFKAASEFPWRRPAPYYIPQPCHRSQPWRPW
ncbi:deadpan-like 1 [Homarus americanus]|uniref:Deadpan-like 1 n=1 Tax=Homarus americanus TaxID=6706 RepID=A0A8J5K1T7_HOMAM|nr:deadpan-like 1 [Homarus americanus]